MNLSDAQISEAEAAKYLFAAGQFAIEPETLPVFAAWMARLFPEDSNDPEHIQHCIAEACVNATGRLLRAAMTGDTSDPGEVTHLAAAAGGPELHRRQADLRARAAAMREGKAP